MGGADAAWRKWSTSIVGGDFTVPDRERQTSPLGVSLLDVFNTRGIAFQDRDFIRRRVFNPIAGSFTIRLSQHDVALRDRLLHLIRFFLEINIRDTARESIGALLDIDVSFVMDRAIGI